MNTPYLIDIDIFRQYEDISLHLKPQRLQVFIKKAQELDLKPFLGHSLYYDLLSYFNADNSLDTAAPPAYHDLYNGCQYTDAAGSTISYDGLTPALVYLTFARFIEADAIHYTAAGPVVKHQDNATALAPAEIMKLVQQQRSVANAHLRNAEKFLQYHHQLFPRWHYNSKNASSRQPGPRIRAVDRTDYNRSGTSLSDDYSVSLYPDFY
ncbi:DUF6712 family protein [Mucilaginibacter sp.]